ncbi:MAG: type II toxin-antitoxin system RelE/ParE family toxin [Bryobacteraceae bacterium]
MADRPAARYVVEYSPAALRQLAKLDIFIRRKVFDDIEKLGGNPRPHGVLKMETQDKLYRVQVGPGKDYRVVYEVRDEVLLVLVVTVGHRKEVYRRVR